METRRLGVAAGFAVLVVSSQARAAPSARLTYIREPGTERCTDEQGLRHAVATRLGYDPFFFWARVTVVAHVHRDGASYRAEVTLVDEAGVSRGTRSLTARGDDCAPLVNALALTISLALDPLSLNEPKPREAEPAPSPPAPPPPPSPASPPSPPSTASTASTASSASSASGPAEEASPPPIAAPVETPPRGWVGLLAIVGSGLTPGVAFGGRARLGLEVMAFSFGVEAGADLPTSAAAVEGGSVRAWSARGTGLACGRLSIVSVCGFVGGGPLVAEGEGLRVSKSAVLGYGIAGPRVGLAWQVTRRLRVEGFGEVGFLLTRRALQVDGADAFRQPVAAPAGGIGLSTPAF